MEKRSPPLFPGTFGAEGAASNWFLISGRLTDTGRPLIANDPHLALSTPPIWYEAHLTVSQDPQRGAMNVNGVSLAGSPGLIFGCNDRICWGGTFFYADVTDVYQEQVVFDIATLTPKSTVFEGRTEPLLLIPQTYRVNQLTQDRPDNVIAAAVGPLEGGLTLIVPRRNNGPIVSVDSSNLQNITGLSIQYTGFGVTRELDAVLGIARAKGLDDFKRNVRLATSAALNFGYADVEGNIACFASSEIPLREDMQTMGRPDGTPPYLIRDGTHHYRNEWMPVTHRQPDQSIPYEIVPFAEMPQVENPAQGFVVNANNDPVGVTLDNNPLARVRTGGGVYYIGANHDKGFRAGRTTGLIRDTVATQGKVSLSMVRVLQAANQMLDAEILVRSLAKAIENGWHANAPPELAALAADPRIAEAVARMRVWDYSTPTGIRGGYDPGDDVTNMTDPSPAEVQNSIATTVYSVWRGRVVENVIDATLKRYGLPAPTEDQQTMAALRNLLDRFPTRQGRGASGVNFFQVEGAPTPESARDILLLRSVKDALDLLASDSFAAAFGRSTQFDAYRWGRLHRIVFSHVLGSQFSVPPLGGMVAVDAALPGVARAGGFQVPDAAGHGVRARTPAGFMFSGGPSRRFMAEMSPGGIRASEIIPGGQVCLMGDPGYANMLTRWLTNGYHPLLLTPAEVQADMRREDRYTP